MKSKNDDIDDLLNEMNDIMNVKKEPQKVVQKEQVKKQEKEQEMDNLDDLLMEMKAMEVKPKQNVGVQQQQVQQGAEMKKKQNGGIQILRIKKCQVVYLGPGRESLNKSCDRLRCMKCDLKVNVFEGFKWSEKSEYLFFRNNFNNMANLATVREEVQYEKNLMKDPNAVAYCCQCLWLSLSEQSTQGNNNWKCAGHEY